MMISALLAYLVVRGVAPEPLFRFQDGRFRTKQLFIETVRMGLDTLRINSKDYSGHSFPKQLFIKIVRMGLDTLGINSKDYTGHRFRIGATTTAAEGGGRELINQDAGPVGELQILAWISRCLSCPASRLWQICQLLNHFYCLFHIHILFNMSLLSLLVCYSRLRYFSEGLRDGGMTWREASPQWMGVGSRIPP